MVNPLTIGEFTFTPDNDISVDFRQQPGGVTEWNLVIRHAQTNDAGTYECQISTRKNRLFKYVHLNVVGRSLIVL